mmetsp:Transcript_9278/g.14080  ORF Transcript_9278/g.14080 Transcript_9278/m.14080 type:complete len:264 (+) Transcript_9278:288-1079(+)
MLVQLVLGRCQALNSVLHSSEAHQKPGSALLNHLNENLIVTGLSSRSVLEKLHPIFVDMSMEHCGILPVPGDSHGGLSLSCLIHKLQITDRVVDGSKRLVIVTSDTNTLKNIILIIGGDLNVEFLSLNRFERVDLVIDGLVFEGAEVLHHSGGSDEVCPSLTSGEEFVESVRVLFRDEVGGVLSRDEGGVIQQISAKVNIVLQSTDLVSIQRSLHPIACLSTVLAPGDQLRNHRIVVHTNLRTFTDTRVAPQGLGVIELRVAF